MISASHHLQKTWTKVFPSFDFNFFTFELVTNTKVGTWIFSTDSTPSQTYMDYGRHLQTDGCKKVLPWVRFRFFLLPVGLIRFEKFFHLKTYWILLCSNLEAVISTLLWEKLEAGVRNRRGIFGISFLALRSRYYKRQNTLRTSKPFFMQKLLGIDIGLEGPGSKA